MATGNGLGFIVRGAGLLLALLLTFERWLGDGFGLLAKGVATFDTNPGGWVGAAWDTPGGMTGGVFAVWAVDCCP